MGWCTYCGQQTAVWQNDFSFEDYCREGEGIVSVWKCTKCGADIEVYIPCDGGNECESD